MAIIVIIIIIIIIINAPENVSTEWHQNDEHIPQKHGLFQAYNCKYPAQM